MTGGKTIERHRGGMIEVTIREEKEEEKETVSFIDALTDRLGITGVVTRVRRITTMIHIGGVTIVIWARTVQMDLLCTLTATTLEDLSEGVAARLKPYKMKAMP